MITRKRVEMTERDFRCLICLSAIVKLGAPTLQIYIAGKHKINLIKKTNFILQEVQGPLEILFHQLHQASPTKKRTYFKTVYFKNLSPKESINGTCKKF